MSLAISLAQWSLHRTILSGELAPLDFPAAARRFGIDAIELVSQLLPVPRRETTREIRRRADGEGVKILLIMVDDQGDLSHPRSRVRERAVRRHRTWIDAAAAVGAGAVRVNSGGEAGGGRPIGPLSPQSAALSASILRCAESCAALADHGRDRGVSVLLENHGGLSANAWALAEVVRSARRENLGLLPDFGNFPAGADRYAAVEAMMPLARAVSAKTYDFDAGGNETTFDFPRMMRLVIASGYSGYVGIEYEGERLAESDGIECSRRLLERWIPGPGAA